MQLCPNCQRRLISQASTRCNWCGSLIEDAEYQAKATVNRESYWAQQQMHDLRMLAWQRSLAGIGPTGDPIFAATFAPIATQRMSMASAQRAAIRAQQMTAQTPPAASTDAGKTVDEPTDVPYYYRRRP